MNRKHPDLFTAPTEPETVEAHRLVEQLRDMRAKGFVAVVAEVVSTATYKITWATKGADGGD